MGRFLVQEVFVNATKGYRYSDEEPYEPWTDHLATLYKQYRKRFGNPQHMFCDLKAGGTRRVGWVFRGRAKYEDSAGSYEREVWVAVLERNAEGKLQSVDVDRELRRQRAGEGKAG
jgi:hypothetical protein